MLVAGARTNKKGTRSWQRKSQCGWAIGGKAAPGWSRQLQHAAFTGRGPRPPSNSDGSSNVGAQVGPIFV